MTPRRDGLLDRVAGLIALGARDPRGGSDEQAVSAALGYARRASHPWSPVNRARPAVGDPAGACGEREFDGAQSTV